jgi:hypothetical protein
VTDPAQDDVPRLIVKGGPTDGFEFPLHKGMNLLVGSGRLANLRVGGDEVGSAHVRIVWDDNGISATDNGSATGTFVNGDPVETLVLWDGDRISFAAKDSKVQPPQILVRIPLGTVDLPPPPPREVQPKPAVRPAQPTARRGPVQKSRPASFSLSSLRLPSQPSFDLPSLPRLSPVVVGSAVGGLALIVAVFFLLQRVFWSAPAVSAIQPAESEPGRTVMLSGRRFDPEAARNQVFFGEKGVPALASTGATLTVVVPDAPPTGGQVSVVVETPRGRSGAMPFQIQTSLMVSGVEPEAAMPGEEVTARGQGFAEGPASVTVGGQAATVVAARRDGLRFRIPALGAEPGTAVPVVVRVGSDTAKPVDLVLGRLPIVLAVSPPRGGPGERVTVKGRGFAADPAGNGVTFGGIAALVLSASPRELVVLAPNPGLQRVRNDADVVVRAGGQASTTHAVYTVVRPSGAAYVLRFFPAAAAEATLLPVHVATDLGPLLVLASPAGAPSVAERAIRTAASLNAAFDQASNGGAVVFEARTQPSPGVGVAGAPDLVAIVAAEDVAAYGAPAESKAVGPTPAAVAEHWAALLNDYLSIFVKNEKPFRLLALSPHGRSLVDLRGVLGSRNGIASERVASLSPELLTRLREAALSPGGVEAGKAGAGAALEGQWDGETQEQDKGVKPITVHLRVQGTRLEGTLTNRSLALAMEVALRDVSFDKGVLRFLVPAGASSRTFIGTLAGPSITGTVHASPTGPAVGRFSLHNVP